MEGIIDFVTGAFRGNTLERLSTQLGETPAAVQRGITQAVPLSLASVAERAQSEQGASELFDRIRDGSYPHMDAGQLAQTVADPTATQGMVQSSTGFLNGFLGNKLNRVVDGVTGASGLSHSSASKLIGLVAPLVLGWIGKRVTSEGLDARGLSRVLAEQGQKVSGKLPAGFSSMFGAARTRGAEGVASHAPRSLKPWLIAALAALAAVLLFWSLGRSRQTRVDEGETATAVTREGARPAVVPPAGPAPARIQPPASDLQPVAGRDVTVLRNDAEPLQAFLEGNEPTPRRFVLDGVRFDSDGANVTPNAMLNDLAKVLAARPSARVSIAGHTDNTGKESLNQKLSQQRAEAVRSYLIQQGARQQQLTAVGKSTSEPMGDNATAEGRAQNRRVELIVEQR